MIKNKAIAKFNDSKFNPAYLLMIFSFVLRLTTFAGMSEGDDLYYALLARRFSQGDFSASFIFDLRWVVFAPVSLFYKIFGVNDITSIAPTIIYGVLSVWLAYQIVNEESDKFTATLASLLYLAFPIVLIYGNFLQVAPSLEFFTLLSVYSFQKGQKTEQIRWFILGGLSIGAIFFARVTGLFIAPLISLYLIYKKGFNKKSMIWIGCAALSSLILPAIQGLIYYSIHGDFFHYIAISKRAVSYQNSMNDVDPKDLFFYVRTLFLKKDFANWRMYGLNGWFFTPILLFALVKSCIKRGGKELLFIIWYLSYFCFMSFVPTSFNPYTTLIRNIRYSIVFVLPMCAIMAFVFADFINKTRAASLISLLLFASVFISNIYFSYDGSARFKARRDRQKDSITQLLKEYPNEYFYLADKNIGRRIAYYSGYKNKNYKHISSLKQIKKRGLFLLLGPGAYSVTRFYIPKKELIAIKKNPPNGLILLKKLPYFNVYRADPEMLSDSLK